jgi:uncharacterized protein
MNAPSFNRFPVALAVTTDLLPFLARIADALDRLAPPPPAPVDLEAGEAFVWRSDAARLEAVPAVSRVDIALLQGLPRQRDILLANTRRFADGLPANNALLWGARGMGKSSLIKAVHAAVNREDPRRRVAIVEIHREDLTALARVLPMLRAAPRPFILFCDDLSFDAGDVQYKSLKAVLEGGIEGRPPNVLFYATSNRRHLMPRDMIDNERATAINPGEAVEEKVSLSDRFGLWLGFHNCDQDTYFAMIEGYAHHFGFDYPAEKLRAEAVEWSVTRGARSGRVAWQYVQDLAGRLGKVLD